MNKMKLYVWENVLTDWTSGMMFVIAEDVEQARRLICESLDVDYDTIADNLYISREPDEYDVSIPTAIRVW